MKRVKVYNYDDESTVSGVSGVYIYMSKYRVCMCCILIVKMPGSLADSISKKVTFLIFLALG